MPVTRLSNLELLGFAIACLLYLGDCIAQPSLKAIVGGTLVNTDGSAPLEDAVVLIEEDRFVAIGAVGTVDIPATAEVIDASGKWIIPGLIDAHVHFFQSGGLYTRPDVIDLRRRVPYEAEELVSIRERLTDTFTRYLRSGVTSVVDVGGPMWNFEVRALAERTALAPRVAVAGPLISTYLPEELITDDPPIVHAKSPKEARAHVRRQAVRDPELIKIWYIVLNQRPKEHLPIVKAAIAESHTRGIRVAVHATELETARAAVRAGADVLVHGVEDQLVDKAFVRLLKENDVVYTTTLVVSEGYLEALTQQIAFTGAEYAIANPYIAATLFDLRALPAGDLPRSVRRGMRNPRPIIPNRFLLQNLRRIHEAGVTVAAGTDAGNIGTLPGPSIFREFALMREAGLTPLEILTAATRGGAHVMGREADLGTIAPGKLADFVLLSADPLTDIGNTSQIYRVAKGGVLYRPDEILEQTPADIVQQQVNAYNARDLDAFLATYGSDIEIYKYPDSLLFAGQEAMRERYSRLFEDVPTLHAEIVDRIALGDYVIDREHVTGLPDGDTTDAVAVYEVRDGLIRRVWFIED